MWFEEHCRRCQELLCDRFEQVNRWIDELAHTGPKFNPYHRKHRHNHEGINEVRNCWGDKAAEAATLHILDDFFGPCVHTEKQAEQIPADEQDYVRRGWF